MPPCSLIVRPKLHDIRRHTGHIPDGMQRKVLDLSDMVSLPWPTAEQRSDFIENLCWAHSWYKCLPFDRTAKFVVFLAESAGAGYETRERPHYGWKTTAEYRTRFGFFDYAWKVSEDSEWGRDVELQIEPSPGLLDCAGFTLGPACSNDHNAIEVLCSLYKEELTASAVEEYALFQTLESLDTAKDEAASKLTRIESEARVAQDMGCQLSPEELAATSSAHFRAFRDYESRLHRHYESMRAPEVAAIQDAIDRLQRTLKS